MSTILRLFQFGRFLFRFPPTPLSTLYAVCGVLYSLTWNVRGKIPAVGTGLFSFEDLDWTYASASCVLRLLLRLHLHLVWGLELPDFMTDQLVLQVRGGTR